MATQNHTEHLSLSALKLIPADPSSVMVIRDITPDLTTLSIPFSRVGRLRIGGRATIVRLRTGNLAVFNPVHLTPEAESKVTEKGGKVKYLAALDIEHHIFLGQWAKRYPDAEVIGMEGLPEKREKDAKLKGTVTFKHVFTKDNKTSYKIGGDFDRDFSYEYIPSHVNQELVFYHRPTGTIIEADLIFNMPATEQYSKAPDKDLLNSGLLQKIFNGIQHTRGDMMGQRRLLWHMAARDREEMKESVKRMDTWGDIKRIIPAHGDVMEVEDAKRTWASLFEWFRDGN